MDRCGVVDIGTHLSGIPGILRFYFGILVLARVVSSRTARCQRAKDVARVGRVFQRSTIDTIQPDVHESEARGKVNGFVASFSEQRPMASISREMSNRHSRTATWLLALIAVVFCQPAIAQTSVWNGTGAGDPWGTAANWTPVAVPNDIFNATARFDGTGAGVSSVAALFSTNFSVAGLQVNQPGSVWNLGSGSDTGELNIGSGGIVFDSGSVGVAQINYRINADYAQSWDSSGATINMFGVLNGGGTITKAGGSILVIDNNNFADSGINRFVGGFNVTTGTLQAGSTMFNSANQTLRSNAVNLASGTNLTTVGSTAILSALKVGQISGSGSVTPGSNGAITIVALGDATFSGSITTTGGLTLQGNNGTTQTFSGNVTGLTGTIGIHSGATLTLSGTGDSTSGVLGPNTGSGTPIALRGGALVLDNSAGNTSATNGRLSNSAAFSFTGGTASLIGHSSGTTEIVGNLTLNDGSSTIRVTNNGGTGAELRFTDSGSLRNSTGMVVNFVGSGIGTLGLSGNNPRISFTGSIFTNTTNGMLANSTSGTAQTIGWAVVNGTSWAGIGANGIVALTDTSRNSATLSSAANWELIGFAPSVGTTTLAANLGTSASLGPGALKISPTAIGQSLDVGTFSIFAPALMLTGSTDFTISGTTGGFGISSGTRYVWITELGTTLNYGASFPGSGPLNKAGAGILNLNGPGSQLPAANINILDGVLRGTTTTLGGSASSGAASTTFNLRGGVLEIDGGGSISRVLGAGTASGGGIRWHSGSERGDGGFSAKGGDATLTLVTTAGGGTPSSPVWSDPSFVQNGYSLIMGSTKADSRIDLTNNIGLDNGALANEYFAREIRVIDNASSSSDIARLSGVISGSANADLLKTGAGTLELTNTNTYTGNTLIAAGTVALGVDHAIANSATAVVMGGTLDIGSFNQNMKAVNLVSGSITGSGGTITGTSYLVQSGSVSANLAGSGVVMNKSTSGTVTLTGANTFSGGANVAAGTLLVNNASGSGTGSGLVNVSGSTAVLGGGNASGTLGFISGPVSIHNSATLHPGMSNAIGILTVNNNVTIGNAADNSNAGSKGTFRVQISSDASTSDLLLIGGASSALNFVTIGADTSTPTNTEVFVDFGLVSGSPFVENTTYTYTIATTSNSANSGIYVNGAEGSLSSIVLASNYAGPATYSLSRMGKNLILSFTPIPEPGFVTAIFAAGLGGIGVYRRWRSRAKTAQQNHSLSL